MVNFERAAHGDGRFAKPPEALERMLRRYAEAGLTAVSDRAVTAEDIVRAQRPPAAL
jgi:hypothetical protein